MSILILELIRLICMHWIISFRIEHIQKGIKKFIDNKNIRTNTFRIQVYNSDIFVLDLLILCLKTKA